MGFNVSLHSATGLEVGTENTADVFSAEIGAVSPYLPVFAHTCSDLPEYQRTLSVWLYEKHYRRGG